MSSGNSSSLPASMSNISIYLEKLLKKPKLHVGPTRERPGPILLNVAATAVKLVVKSKFSTEISSIETTKMTAYVMK